MNATADPEFTLVAHPHSRCILCKSRIRTPSGANPRTVVSGLLSHYNHKHGTKLLWNRRIRLILLPFRGGLPCK